MLAFWRNLLSCELLNLIRKCATYYSFEIGKQITFYLLGLKLNNYTNCLNVFLNHTTSQYTFMYIITKVFLIDIHNVENWTIISALYQYSIRWFVQVLAPWIYKTIKLLLSWIVNYFCFTNLTTLNLDQFCSALKQFPSMWRLVLY